ENFYRIARALGKNITELRVALWNKGRCYEKLISLMQQAGIQAMALPGAMESYATFNMLDEENNAGPDVVLGLGLPETLGGCSAISLLRGGKGWFRVISRANTKSATNLSRAFNFTAQERSEYRLYGIDLRRKYAHNEFFANRNLFSISSGVTGIESIPAIRVEGNEVTTASRIIDPSGAVWLATIRSRLGESAETPPDPAATESGGQLPTKDAQEINGFLRKMYSYKKIAFGDNFERFSQWYGKVFYTFLYHKKLGEQEGEALKNLNPVEGFYLGQAGNILRGLRLVDLAEELEAVQDAGRVKWASGKLAELLASKGVLAYNWKDPEGNFWIFLRPLEKDPRSQPEMIYKISALLAHEAGAIYGLAHSINRIIEQTIIRYSLFFDANKQSVANIKDALEDTAFKIVRQGLSRQDRLTMFYRVRGIFSCGLYFIPLAFIYISYAKNMPVLLVLILLGLVIAGLAIALHFFSRTLDRIHFTKGAAARDSYYESALQISIPRGAHDNAVSASTPQILSHLPPKEKMTQIIATIGPSSEDEETLRQMMLEGMNVARFNFSHVDDYPAVLTVIKRVRSVAQELKRPITIFADLQGPKVRVLGISKPIPVEPGETVLVAANSPKRSSSKGQKVITVDYPLIASEVKRGQRILIEDGNIRLRVIDVNRGESLTCRVEIGGEIQNRKGVNLPDSTISMRSLTEKDLRDLEFAVIEADVDMVALSFVRSRKDILDLKKELKRLGCPDMPIIAKIETPQALRNIEGILREVNAIMVARGDLAVETAPQKVPRAQRKLARMAREQGVPVIVATQMLESMRGNVSPTRAEAGDVDTAVWQLADAVMLSAETSTGKYPVEAVRMMNSIALETEDDLRSSREADEIPPLETIPEAIIEGALYIAERINARALVVFTKSGSTCRSMAQLRPSMPIIAITPLEDTARQLNLVRGVYPVLVSHEPGNLDEFEQYAVSAVQEVLARQLRKAKGDFYVVLTYGEPGVSGKSNKIEILNLTEHQNCLWLYLRNTDRKLLAQQLEASLGSGDIRRSFTGVEMKTPCYNAARVNEYLGEEVTSTIYLTEPTKIGSQLIYHVSETPAPITLWSIRKKLRAWVGAGAAEEELARLSVRWNRRSSHRNRSELFCRIAELQFELGKYALAKDNAELALGIAINPGHDNIPVSIVLRAHRVLKEVSRKAALSDSLTTEADPARTRDVEGTHQLIPITQLGAVILSSIAGIFSGNQESTEVFSGVFRYSYSLALKHLFETGPPILKYAFLPIYIPLALFMPVARGLKAGEINWLCPGLVKANPPSEAIKESIRTHESAPSELTGLYWQFAQHPATAKGLSHLMKLAVAAAAFFAFVGFAPLGAFRPITSLILISALLFVGVLYLLRVAHPLTSKLSWRAAILLIASGLVVLLILNRVLELHALAGAQTLFIGLDSPAHEEAARSFFAPWASKFPGGVEYIADKDAHSVSTLIHFNNSVIERCFKAPFSVLMAFFAMIFVRERRLRSNYLSGFIMFFYGSAINLFSTLSFHGVVDWLHAVSIGDYFMFAGFLFMGSSLVLSLLNWLNSNFPAQDAELSHCMCPQEATAIEEEQRSRPKIISGGQTGADRGALEGAKIAGLPTGGWAPKDYHTAKGPDPALKEFGADGGIEILEAEGDENWARLLLPSLRQTWSARLNKGLIPAVPVWLYPDGGVNEEVLRRYAAVMAQQDIIGVAINVHTGRGPHLFDEERRRVYEIWREALGPERIIVCGVNSQASAQQAKEWGVDAVLVMPP
ncbi:MAG: pyruvate kinase, partial [Candidatus Omnitrophota bacterium]